MKLSNFLSEQLTRTSQCLFLKARYPDVYDNDGNLRGVCGDKHAEDSARALRGHYHLQHPRVLRQGLPIQRVLTQVSEH